ncbi:hypothetical protein [Gracilibacillus thailandensis]|uniref:Uncharacterized protein n=1 Tax=Gracilibacillus thailandensis TaxID=563735 RepID=A0A6N7QUJ0_9BACI|nr:hypothetical protein [Gracilibacillus thailandensis]MRI65214.1 hypothetical protein [Gracilibacillus thailandensis]
MTTFSKEGLDRNYIGNIKDRESLTYLKIGYDDEETISHEKIMVAYNTSKRPYRKVGESVLTGFADYDDIADKYKNATQDIVKEYIQENKKLKKYIMEVVNSVAEGELTEDVKLETSLDLYNKGIFHMNDVLEFNNLTVDGFYNELSKRNMTLYYEDDLEINEDDIEEWL